MSDFGSHDWGHRTTCGLENFLVPTTVVLMVKTFVLGKEGILDSGFLTAFKSFLVAMRTEYNIPIDIYIY